MTRQAILVEHDWEMLQKGIKIFLLGFQYIFHSPGGGTNFINVSLNRDFVPDGTLIGLEIIKRLSGFRAPRHF